MGFCKRLKTVFKAKNLTAHIFHATLHMALFISLELFKSEYSYYGRDLLDMLEEGFLDYLHTFFYDEGLPYFAETIKTGTSGCKLYDLVRDMKSSLNPKLYKNLWDN